MEEFLSHMLPLGYFGLGAPQPQAGTTPPQPTQRGGPGTPVAHSSRGRFTPPPPCPSMNFVASLRLVSGTLECPAQGDPRPYQDLPWGFSGQLRGALFPPWIIGPNSLTAWEARIVGADWAQEWSQWCMAASPPKAPAEWYAATPLEGRGRHTQLGPTTIRGADPEGEWDAESAAWLRAAPEPHIGWQGNLSWHLQKPLPPPRLCYTRQTYCRPQRYVGGSGKRPPCSGSPQKGGTPDSRWGTSKRGCQCTMTP